MSNCQGGLIRPLQPRHQYAGPPHCSSTLSHNFCLLLPSRSPNGSDHSHPTPTCDLPPFHPIFFLPFIALLFLPLSEGTLRDQKLLQKYEIRWGPTPVRCTYGENKESARTGCKPSCGVFSLCFLICLNSHWSGVPELCRAV